MECPHPQHSYYSTYYAKDSYKHSEHQVTRLLDFQKNLGVEFVSKTLGIKGSNRFAIVPLLTSINYSVLVRRFA